MALTKKDVEQIEKMLYKNGDDLAVSLARCFERVEERLDTLEARLVGRITDLDDRVCSEHAGIEHSISQVRGDVRELMADEA